MSGKMVYARSVDISAHQVAQEVLGEAAQEDLEALAEVVQEVPEDPVVLAAPEALVEAVPAAPEAHIILFKNLK